MTRSHTRSTTRALLRSLRPALVVVCCCCAVAGPALATNGYFAHGFGTASKGLAGAGVALPQDALAAATNPAGMAFLGRRYDAGLAFFSPDRRYAVEGAPSRAPGTFGLVPGTVESGSTMFEIPYFGFNRPLSGSRASFGVTLYAQGGMNTDYPTATFFGSSPTGVDLSQLFLAPTYARRLGERHAVGVTPILAFQRFRVQGVEAFGAFSSAPGALSNRGHDESVGAGVRVGYLGRLTSRLSVGASVQSEVLMGTFDDYQGLFAERGDFDVPASVTVGVAYEARPGLTLLLDLQEIYYSEVRSVGRSLLPNLATAPLGAADGPGFGWRDMTVVKAGLQWRSSERWTWRLGVSAGDQPIPDSELLLNILAPGVMEEHVSFGLSRRLRSGRAVHLAVTRALAESISGPNPLEVPGTQEITLAMDQWDVEVGFSWGL